ncbi:unnamed protein product [Nesidiocoris tenuis]|uniref:Uncharacterized protein n=1 Tax=Nesidiocoris tenuis TaxID=355587 RepID=A0A6H5GQG2_9HEMI|nr:unnamed protein product [Nesidiocoris tenuis]CAB0006297.1 unnamed protein product [Nesidiocoris tenuis]
MDEDVDDAVHYYQMKKWLDYDATALVAELRNETDRRIKAVNYVWTKDVKNALAAELQAAEDYDQELREEAQSKIDKELERTQKNEHHLKLLLQGLEEVRKKMVRERYATKMSVEKQQAEEYNFLVQESYDRTVNQLKASTAFNFNTTQAFFMRTTENDISLTHELHAEQKRIERRAKLLKSEVASIKKELAMLEKPLAEKERIARWMETAVAALQKDMRSKHDQERVNVRMTKEIKSIGEETSKFEIENRQMSVALDSLRADLNDVDNFRNHLSQDNVFLKRMNRMTRSNERKIVRLRKNLKDRFGLGDCSFRIVRRHVLKNVERCKRKRLHNLLETKAFNEMSTQLDLRAKDLEVKNHIPMEKLVVNYRKTSANIITTFDEKKIINSIQNRL